MHLKIVSDHHSLQGLVNCADVGSRHSEGKPRQLSHFKPNLKSIILLNVPITYRVAV